MSQSSRLRLADIRRVYRLIGDCRDLGHDPQAWQRRMLEGLVRLIGGIATGGEARWPRPGGPLHIVSALDTGFSAAGRRQFAQFVREHGQVADPINQAIQRSSARLIVGVRRQFVDDRAWYRSPAFQEFRRPSGIDHQLTALSQITPDGYCIALALYRPLGERDFSQRERRVLRFFVVELSPIIGTTLHCVGLTPYGVLPPRLREVLFALLRGKSEKQIAANLGLSPTTVHDYVQALYQRFEVSSRAELMAWFLRRGWNEELG